MAPTRRRLRAIGLLMGVTGALVFAAAPPAEAAELDAAAWWSRTVTTDPLSESPQPLPFPNPTTPAPGPGDRSVSDGQLLVEGTTEGATAIAAMRWTMPDARAVPTLAIPVAIGSSVNPQSLVVACRAATPWEPPEQRPGPWDTKPVVNGQQCVTGEVAGDASSVTFELGSLVYKTTLDIVLVPGQRPDAPSSTSTFRMVFDDPTPASLTIVSPPAPTPTPDLARPVAVVAPVATTPAAPPPRGIVVPPAPVTTMPSVDLPSVVPALPDDAFAAPVQPVPLEVIPAGLTEESNARLVGLALLLVGALVAAWSHLTPPAPEMAMIGLGRFRRAAPTSTAAPATTWSAAWGADSGEPVTGGLGRFVRVRDEPPVPIA